MPGIKNPYYLTEEAEAWRQEEIKKLARERNVQTLLRQIKKDESFLATHSAVFKEINEGFKICQNCKGLEFCRQPLKGKCKTLFLDETGYVNDQYLPCHYSKKKAAREKNKYMYKIRHLDDEQLQINLQEIDVSSETGSYTQALLEAFQSMEERKGLFLYGEPGTGKTYMMIGLANYLIETRQTKVAFVKISQMISDIRSNIKDEDYRRRTMDIMMKVPVLFIDDLGAEQVTPWTRDSILFPILDYRMNHGMKTYFTSNYSLEGIEKLYTTDITETERVAAMRLMERVKALTRPVKLTGKSRRL